jgi:hypothetical protein
VDGGEALLAGGSVCSPNPAVDPPPSPNACALTSGVAPASVRIASRSSDFHSPSA